MAGCKNVTSETDTYIVANNNWCGSLENTATIYMGMGSYGNTC